MKFSTEATALLLIDVQKGLDEWDFYGGNRNNLDAEVNMATILAKWRQLRLHCYHVKHSSQNPSSPLHASKAGFEIKPEVTPLAHEPVITKNTNSAFINTLLEKDLKTKGITSVVIVGLTTNHCISTSVRMAANLGFITYVIADATATFDSIGWNGEKFDSELMHQTTLASLNKEFATILTTQELLLMV